MNVRSSTKVVIVALGLAITYTAFFSSPAAERGPGVRRPSSLGELSFLASPLDEPGRIACCRHFCQDGAADRLTAYGDAPALKIDPRSARSPGCAPPAAGMAGEEAFPAGDLLPKSSLALPNAKAGQVAAMVERALGEQARMLKARKAEMEEWDRPAQARFARWFGTLDQNAQLQIYRRLGAVLKINAAYSVRNFRRAVPSRQGVYAYVFANDPSRVYLDKVFVTAPSAGASSKAGTITHEMSHFTVAGGTKDHAYGPQKCKELARTSPQLALTNADNFEFYVEGVE